MGVRPPARGFGDNGAILPGAQIEATRRPAVGVGSNACMRAASVVAGVGRRERFCGGFEFQQRLTWRLGERIA